MHNLNEGILVCRLSELADIQAISRELTVGERKFSVIVCRDNNAVRVFLNSCPHTGVRLEWRENDFMDGSGKYLMCSMHGALFQPNDGVCVEGPCVGDSLVALATMVDNDCLYVLDADAAPQSARRP